MELKINYDNLNYNVNIKKEEGMYKIIIGDHQYIVDAVFLKENLLSLIIDGNSYEAMIGRAPDGCYELHFYNDFFKLLVEDARAKAKKTKKDESPDAPKKIVAPMAGKILKLTVNKGDKVKTGDVLVVIEAMKMQNEIKSAGENIVSDVLVKVGDSVSPMQPLIILSNL